ncbi:chromosome segregation protein SMC common bacterial type [Aspergillus parasiticus SU-1]|uniref:Chromosome segregation protein SMC common bacterial type n=1 Tax=Aspergillus parasiticus (strain ATCC 56775 / NRRL 5862 / SRRC 143 / SU-1) TaxID=1403190 RepID=A0A0F0I5S7_ASPPU|nr:chromosome segregation protein SMC common bacterial type [Aspergillus parasiticus SU-1]
MSSEHTFTSNARDPRLNRPPPPYGTTSQDTQSRKFFTSPSASRQYEPRADAPGDQFVQRLSDLIQAAVKTASLTSEKEVIQKKQSTTEGLLKRTKAQQGFPSTTAFFQQTWNDEGGHLARIDGALKEHLSRYDQLEKVLKANWTSSIIAGPSLVDKYDQLKEEIETTKQDAKRSKDEATSLRDQNRSLEDTLKSLQARMTILEKSLENHGTSLSQQTKDQSSRFDEISLEFEKRLESVSTKVEERVSTKFHVEVDEWQKQRAALGTELESLRTCQKNFSVAIGKVDQTTKEQQQKISDIESLGQRLDMLDTRLGSVESTRMAPPTITATNDSNVDKVSASHLQTKVESLENILNQLQGLQEMKDDLHFSEVEDLKKSLVQASEELEVVKNNCNVLSSEVKTLRELNPSTALQQVANLSGSLQSTQQLVETVRVGLHSLETRYNSLTTEPLARNMVVALQEMYPSASQLLEQYSGLKTVVDNLCQSQNTVIRQTQQEAALRLDEINKLRNDHASLSGSLAPLWEHYEQQKGQNPPPSHDDISKLRVELQSLSTKFEGSISKYDSQFRSRKQSDDRFMDGLREERDKFDSRLSQVASGLESLANDVEEVRSANTENMEKLANDIEEVRSVNTSSLAKVETHAIDIKSLQDDLHELKKATSDRHQAFLDQLGDITKAHSAHDSNISSLLDRISELERSEKLRHKELHEQLDELKKAVEAKVFHPRAVSPIVVEDQAPNPTDDSLADPEEAARILNVAETNPGLALRERKKKKKKRPRPSGLSEDEKTPIIPRQESPRSLSSGASPFEQGESTENKRPKKKKKSKMASTEPIPLD